MGKDQYIRIVNMFLMALRLQTKWLALIFSFLCGAVSGQNLESYRVLQVLEDQTLEVFVPSIQRPTILASPQLGNLTIEQADGYGYVLKYEHNRSIGLDTIVVKAFKTDVNGSLPSFEGYALEVKKVIAHDDYYVASNRYEQLSLDVLTNDESHDPITIREIAFVNNGSASIDPGGRNILFVPDQSGYAQIGYIICGRGCSYGVVAIKVEDNSDIAPENTLKIETWRDQTISFFTPVGYERYHPSPILGQIYRDRAQVFTYTPARGFVGTDEVEFSKVQDGIRQFQTVEIKVSDPFVRNGWSRDDHLYTEVSNATTFSVVDNDLSDKITSFNAEDLEGTLTHLGKGLFRYEPPSSYEGQTGFQYTICSEGRCDESSVAVTVHNFMPQYDDIELFTVAGIPSVIDYDVPIDEYTFEVVKAPFRGEVTIREDLRAVIYESLHEGQDEMILRYCTPDGSCKNILCRINSQDVKSDQPCTYGDCVWQGDHNTDGVVDMQDALILAANLGETGPQRSKSAVGHYWYGVQGFDWLKSDPLTGTNLKHVDSNGDGILSPDDLYPMDDYYENCYRLVPKAPYANEGLSLSLKVETPEVRAGEWASFELSLADHQSSDDESEQVLATGLNFSLEIPSRVVDSSSVHFSLANDGIFTPLNRVLTYSNMPRTGRIDVAIGKTDRIPIAKDGVIGHIKFIVEEDINGFRSLKDLIRIPVKISKVSVQLENGSTLSLRNGRESFFLDTRKDETFTLFPNPASAAVQINRLYSQYEVYNQAGVRMLQGYIKRLGSTSQIDLSPLPTGLYIVKLKTKEGLTTIEKLQIIR